ncbi:Cation channel sperm-associated protein 1 [Phlyctochytrium bullatum]|nr:Cation channel sperm-associated protein 1 [Phlyctochytrium bullatum]
MGDVRSIAGSEVSNDEYLSHKPLSSSSNLSHNSSRNSIELGVLSELRSDRIRRLVFEFTQGPIFQNFILIVIIMNSILVCLETLERYRKPYGWYLALLDDVFLGIYIMEMWLISYLLSRLAVDLRVFRLLRLFRTIRAFRTLRVLRTLSYLRSLQVILSTVLKSIPAMRNILLLSALTLYVFSAWGTVLFQDVDPRRFGSVGRTAFRLFQIMSQDTWTNLYRDNSSHSWFIYYYVMAVEIVMHFIFLNLFVAVFVNNLQYARKKLEEERRAKRQKNKDLDPFLVELEERSEKELVRKKEEDVLSEVFEEESGVENFYTPNMPKRQKELLSAYFSLLAALDLNQHLHQRQMKVLDELIDLSQKQE